MVTLSEPYFTFSATINLNDLDKAVYVHCIAKAKDYTETIGKIEDQLNNLTSVTSVMFNHSSWVIVDLETANAEVAATRIVKIREKIVKIFSKYI